MQEPDSNEKQKPAAAPLATTKQKHRPAALPLNKPLLKMQDVAAELLSPGLDEKKLNQDQQKVFKQSKLIQLQQKQLIANTLYDTVPTPGNDSNKRKSNTIIIEQVSDPEAKKLNPDSLSPLPNAKRFKRSKAPTPLKLAENSKDIVPSIQTAPIKNNQSSLYKSKNDFINNLRNVNHNKQPFKSQPLSQQQQSNVQIIAAAQAAAAAAVAQSPLNSAFFAPRYLPNLSVAPPVMTPSVYSQFYQSMMNNAAAAQAAASSGTPTTASMTTPLTARQQNQAGSPASATATAFQFQKQAVALQQAAALQQAMFQQQLIAAQTAAQAATQAALATGTPIASSVAQAVSSPLTAFGTSFPMTPLSYGFRPSRALPTTTSSQNYVVAHRENTANSNNSQDSTKPIDVDKKQDNGTSKINESEKSSASDDEVKDITAPRSVTFGLKAGKTPSALNKRNLMIANPPKSESSTSKLRKSLQSPVGASIIKQTIVSSLGSNANKEPKTPINIKKTNTPHVTDVFPNEMTKFAPLANQPLSAREERFDFAMYKDDSSRTAEKSSNREKTKTGKLNDQDDDQDDDDDVENKAIE